MFSELKDMFSSSHNFKKLRAAIEAQQSACVPFIGTPHVARFFSLPL
jgi:hypothetical protein